MGFLSVFRPSPGHAVDAVRVSLDSEAIDLTPAIEHYQSDGVGVIHISTAPGEDGIVRKITVRARDTESRPDWIVFALSNDTNEQVDRLLVAPHFYLSGSGLFWPDLGSSRIAAVTASQGIPAERQESPDEDVFLITLDPGSTVTFVAELTESSIPKLTLWQVDAYKDRTNGSTLYKGIIIGIAGLLSLFLTVIFVVKGAMIFPAAAALSWAVFAYAAIDFSFFQRVFPITDNTERIYRAGAEAVLAATLLVFLFAYLNLNRWHVRYSHITAFWLIILGALVGLAVYMPPVAAGIARLSIGVVAVGGFVLVVHLVTHGYNRAIMLIPTWILLVAWVIAAGFTISGELTNDFVPSALIGGLVLIVMLIGFTIIQHAFVGGVVPQGMMSDMERRAFAVSGAGDIIFDWDVVADRVYVSAELENILGLRSGALDGPASTWLTHMHPFDRDRYVTVLDSIIDRRRGRINFEFRLRSEQGTFHWLRLRARPVVGTDGEVARVAGTLMDITDLKTNEERLLFDTIHDNLTGLPNRQLFSDRLDQAMRFAAGREGFRPTVLLINIKNFRDINARVGLSVGDSILLTLARRLSRLLKPEDTLTRIGGDQVAILLISEVQVDRILSFAEVALQAATTPLTHGTQEIIINACIGIALYAPLPPDRYGEVLRNAEIALSYARRKAGDAIDVFRPTMRSDFSDRLVMESDLRQAIEQGALEVHLLPVVHLEDRTVAGFEARLVWPHPRLGHLLESDFMPVADEVGLGLTVRSYALERVAHELAGWQQAVEVNPPIFATVNMSSQGIMRHDLLQEVKAVVARSGVAPLSLLLEFNETIVMENPEQSVQIMSRLHDMGAGLCLDDFGTRYSALSYMQRLPLDMIKIDQSFVRQMADGNRPVILRSIVKMATELGLEVIAEGIETESDAVELLQLGCRYAEGPAFGDPMSMGQARQIMHAAA
ncbi:MAG: sensor domain-containing phosphodiesterase [Methylobacteriaceae bacterium]|nr:sensor domain-containing phosphodiesterase [Methylobacteriaceae bacterium]